MISTLGNHLLSMREIHTVQLHLQACYRATKAAFNLKKYDQAVMLAEQGLALETDTPELKRLKQVCIPSLLS